MNAIAAIWLAFGIVIAAWVGKSAAPGRYALVALAIALLGTVVLLLAALGVRLSS